MKPSLLEGVDTQIAETNRYLMQSGKEVSDPRAIEMVKETGQYAKNRGMPVSDYVHSDYDTNQLTKLFAKGVSEEDLINFYKNPIKDNVDLDTMPENYEDALKRTGYFFNNMGGVMQENQNPYQNINLKKFFEFQTEEKVSYLSKLKNFGKKALPVALAASLVAAPVVAENSYEAINLGFPGDEADPFDDTNHFFNMVTPSEILDNCRGFDREYKLQEELIKPPDEVTENLKMGIKQTNIDESNFGKIIMDNQLTYFDRISVSDLDLGVWSAASSFEHPEISPYLIGLDTDGDGKIETLGLMYNQGKGLKETSTIKNHALKVPEVLYDNYGNKLEFTDSRPTYVGNLFNVPENPEDYTAAEKAVFWENTKGIRVTDKVIYYSDIIGKNRRMLGLDPFDNPNDVYYKDDFQVHGEADNFGYPDWFKGTESDKDYDNTYNLLYLNTLTGILQKVNGFEEVPLDLDKPIPFPDKTNLIIMNNMYKNRTCLIKDYQDDGVLEKGKIYLPETYLAVWGLSGVYTYQSILPELVYVSVDDDPEPEHLISVKRTIHTSKENPLTEALGEHVKLVYFCKATGFEGKEKGPFANYLVDLYNTQPEFEKLKREVQTEASESAQYAPHLYIDNPEDIVIFGPESKYPPIGFEDLYDEEGKQFKTPRDLGLTEDNSVDSVVLKKPLDEFDLNKDYSKLIPGYVDMQPKDKDKFPLAGILPEGIGALEIGAGLAAVGLGVGAAHLLIGKKSGPIAV